MEHGCAGVGDAVDVGSLGPGGESDRSLFGGRWGPVLADVLPLDRRVAQEYRDVVERMFVEQGGFAGCDDDLHHADVLIFENYVMVGFLLDSHRVRRRSLSRGHNRGWFDVHGGAIGLLELDLDILHRLIREILSLMGYRLTPEVFVSGARRSLRGSVRRVHPQIVLSDRDPEPARMAVHRGFLMSPD